jgi:DNA repair photolyase
MNTLDEKRDLWDTLVDKKIFKQEVNIEVAQQMFETLVVDIDKRSLTLEEKKQVFLQEYEQLMNKEAQKKREEWFESRLNKKVLKPPPSMKELNEIKQLLYKILHKVESL